MDAFVCIIYQGPILPREISWTSTQFSVYRSILIKNKTYGMQLFTHALIRLSYYMGE